MSTYLAVDLAAILIPLFFTFHPALRFDRRYRTFWPACAVVALVFLLWDAWFTARGVWGFNPSHLAGWHLFNLPAEEILFFFCIPYACVFTYHCFERLRVPAPGQRTQHVVTVVLLACLLVPGLAFLGRAYTATTFLLMAASLAWWQFAARVTWLGRFYIAYSVLLIPFLAVNGVLTGSWLSEPVVWYDDTENLGLRIGTIPVEDVFYGMLLIGWIVAAMEWLEKKRLRGEAR